MFFSLSQIYHDIDDKLKHHDEGIKSQTQLSHLWIPVDALILSQENSPGPQTIGRSDY